jgi:peroxiredoxin
LALAILVAVSTVSETNDTGPEEAIQFELPTTAGETVALDETLAEGDTLLYFSMGVGCDGCFAQIPEIETALAERGLSLLSIMVDPAPMVAAEAARFGIQTPILIDDGAQVSRDYGMVGVYGHADRPSHSFALVRQDGTIGWVRHYAEMFVPADALLAELDAALES